MAVKYKIYTLGCKVNQYDSGKLAAKLERAGLVMAKKRADLAIINSCAVTKTAIIKSGRMVKLARKENPKAKIILAGCWPRVEDAKINMAEVDKIIKESDIKKLTNSILSFRPPSRNPGLVAQNLFLDCGSEPAMTNRSRYFIKIQDGCEQYCSYCIIPYTRGKLTSRGEAEVINEIKQAVKAGYGEIVLSGIHLGLYGRESHNAKRVTHNDNNLTGLLKKIIKIKNLGRARLSSIEVTEVSAELIKLIASTKKICQHLHLPLQAGSDKILKLMNRPYDTKYFKNKIKQIRRAMPDIAIATDVMVGFSGETEKDFRDTEKFIKQIKFSRLHVFPFSAHAKTPAAKFAGQVDEKIKIRRAKILRALGLKLAEDYKKKFKGRELGLVVEQINQDEIIGKTEYYFDIEIKKKKLKANKLKVGEIIKVKYLPR